MESNNLPPFYVGEEVEYVTGKKMPKGTKVIVNAVFQEKCGCWLINHDKGKQSVKTEDAYDYGHITWKCLNCGKNFGRYDRYGWYASSFRRLQRPKPMTFIKLAEIQETEKEEVLTLN